MNLSRSIDTLRSALGASCALVLLLGTAAGCGGSSGTSGPDTTTGDMATSAQSFSWPGTWNVELSYEAACDTGFGNIKKGMQQHTNTMQLAAGSGSALTAEVMGYELSGTGSSSSLTLSGQYPIRDHSGNVSSNVMRENNVTISINKITDSSRASGSIMGSYKGQFGFSCTVSSGTVNMTR